MAQPTPTTHPIDKLLPIEETDEAIQKAKQAVADYDFIRFTTVDMNGIARGCMMSGQVAQKFIPNGTTCFSGMMCFGPKNQIVVPQMVLDAHYKNVHVVPDLSTLHSVPWGGDDKYRMGQLLCETHWDAKTPQEASTRNIARRMLAKLDDMGLKMYSGMEVEYMLLDRKSQKPVFEGNDYMTWVVQSEFDSWYCAFEKNMKQAGVSIEAMHSEYGPGQFEFVTEPQFGIKGPDSNFILKQCVKEMALKRGWEATFMAKRFIGSVGNGSHFNFSIWEKAPGGANVLWDENGLHNLSEFGHHWLGGMMQHAKAISALCCMTTNCYKRLHCPWAPAFANWGIQDRTAFVRVKNDGPNGTYYENRLPSSLYNPYLVIAVTIAAGIDGVLNKTPCPDPYKVSDVEPLPYSLEEALQHLQEDTAIIALLGKTFIEWFVQMKTEADLKAIEGVTDPAEQLQIEVKQYSKYC